MDHWSAGDVLVERYRLVEMIGEGAVGEVWRADHLSLRAPVAIKLMNEEVVGDDKALARFLREARAAASLRSAHVVQVLDCGIAEGSAFIVMELLAGETLHQRIESRGSLGAVNTLQVMGQVGEAVTLAHENGIVHRDLKPRNIQLVPEREHEVAKVLDFGIAKIIAKRLEHVSVHTSTGEMLGTPLYMSPEQLRGRRDVDHRADLWALAIVTFECLLARRPIAADTLGDLILAVCLEPMPRASTVAPVPPGFDDWFNKATEREPANRFQTAKEMFDGLSAVLG